jgi:hypothetical protein
MMIRNIFNCDDLRLEVEGFTRQQLSNWLTGSRLPGLANYFKIPRYLDSKKGQA